MDLKTLKKAHDLYIKLLYARLDFYKFSADENFKSKLELVKKEIKEL